MYTVQDKVLTYVKYRAVFGVFQNIDPPTPLHPASVSSPRTKGQWAEEGGGGGWGVNILEEARHRTGLLQYNLSYAVQYSRYRAMEAWTE